MAYTLDKSDNGLRLEIKADRNIAKNCLYIMVIIMAFISLVGTTFFAFANDKFGVVDYIMILCLNIAFIAIIVYVIYIMGWEKSGKEIFVLQAYKLHHIIENRSFDTQEDIFDFSQIEFGCQLSNIETCEIDQLNKYYLIGRQHSIIFCIDDEHILTSERKIPVAVIKEIKKEYESILKREIAEK